MALVPDINGVCNNEGTLEMTSKPTKTESTKTKNVSKKISVSGTIKSIRFGDEFFVHELAAMRDEAAFDDFVVELENERFVLFIPEFLDQAHEVGGINLAGVQRRASRKVGDADNFYPVPVDHFVVSDAFDV